MIGDLSFVSGDCGPSSAFACSICFLEEGAFSSHLILDGISLDGECSFTVESGVFVVVVVAVSVGLRIGTNADLTTSICSSSESSSDDECMDCSFVEFNSMEELILWAVDWLLDGGLDEEFLEEAGDSLELCSCVAVELEVFIGWAPRIP